MKTHFLFTVKSVLEDCLVFNFWTFGAVLYSSFFQFLLNKNPNFHNFFSLLFEKVFYSNQSFNTDFTVCVIVYVVKVLLFRYIFPRMFVNLLCTYCIYYISNLSNLNIFFPGTWGPYDAEQEVLCRNRSWCFRQEPQNSRRTCPTIVHPCN